MVTDPLTDVLRCSVHPYVIHIIIMNQAIDVRVQYRVYRSA